nr:MAG TPA: protein of unknown function (DUF4094) [Caudoviricetes sp.]
MGFKDEWIILLCLVSFLRPYYFSHAFMIQIVREMSNFLIY